MLDRASSARSAPALVAVPVSTMLTGSELGTILADSGARRARVHAGVRRGRRRGGLPPAPEVDAPGRGRATPSLAVPDGGRPARRGRSCARGGAAPRTHAVGRRHRRRRLGAVALHLRHHRAAQGGDAPARQHPARLRDLRRAGARHPPRRPVLLGREAVLRLRHRQLACSSRSRSGATTVLEPRRPDARRSSPSGVGADRPTLFFGVPTFYAALLAGDLPGRHVRVGAAGASAGEALPAPAAAAVHATASASTIIDGIGSTEALHIFLSNRPGDIRPGTTRHGRARVRGARSATTTAQPVPAGEPGALYVARRVDRASATGAAPTPRGRCSRASGWSPATPTSATTTGYYTCLGRNSDMLKAGGIWVSPAEVESRLLEHPAVREAAVVGVADERRARQAGGRGRRPTGVTRARSWSPWCRDGPRALQGAAAGGVRRRPAQDRDRQAAAVQGPPPAGQQPERLRGSNHVPYVIARPASTSTTRRASRSARSTASTKGSRKSYINPKECIDCGACEPVCPVEAITQDRRVADGDEAFVEDNAAFFTRCCRAATSRSACPAGPQGG